MPIDMERWNGHDAAAPQIWAGPRTRRAVWSLECHYCGFERAVGEASPARCPKCGGSAWELVAAPGSLLTPEAGYDAARTTDRVSTAGAPAETGDVGETPEVTFRMRCDALQVYLMFGAAPGSRKIIPLEQREQSEWGTCVSLPPGRYRYRFLIDDGARLNSPPAPNAARSGSTGLDGWLLVPARGGTPAAEA